MAIQESFTPLNNALFAQILMRNFSKRQRAIIDLVIRLSYGCKRERAYIPRLSDFIICGVDKHHIKSELKQLQQKNVIGWDSITHEFWILREFEKWDVPVPNENQVVALNELVRLNISGYRNSNLSYKSGNQSEGQGYKIGNRIVTETVTLELQKQQPENAEIPVVATAEEVLIIKSIEKDNSTSPTPALNEEQEAALKTLHSFLKPKSDDAEWILNIAEKYPKVDLADAAWNLKMWLQERPDELKKKANHRSRFRNFVKGDDERKKWRKAHSRVKTHSDTQESDYDKRIREAVII